MYERLLKPLKSNSFFVFGARGTGKSTLIKSLYDEDDLFEVDLLDPLRYEEAAFGLAELKAEIEEAVSNKKTIFIDEVQKEPRLLDVAQHLIDKQKAKFILTGSSARKLKRGSANLMAGRAYTYSLFPLISEELGDAFDLDTHLKFGGLPHVWNVDNDKEREIYLRSYVATYIKEEIAEEQMVRKLEPFRRFIQIAAQVSGQPINYKKISREVNVSDQSVKTYFQILEETLLGYTLNSYHKSIRKSQSKAAKFYLFDTGVLRTLNRTVTQPLPDSNYSYGTIFEHFLISEIIRTSLYLSLDYELSFLRLANGHEIDLIVDRPGRPLAAIEIKSTKSVKEEHVKVLRNIGADIGPAEMMIFSRDPQPKKFGEVRAVHWQQGLRELFDL